MINELRRWIKLCETIILDDIPPNPEGMIDAFDEEFDQSDLVGRVTVSLRVDPRFPDTTIELNHISTKTGLRGNGLATKAMAMLTKYADQYNVVLSLGVALDADGRNGSMTTEQLVDWYSNWGFEGGQTMRRTPNEP